MSRHIISTHTLTWSVTRFVFPIEHGIYKFQLTRSRGAWHCHGLFDHFRYTISTHTLTWSVTNQNALWFFWRVISTHTLTWSVTRAKGQLAISSINFNSHAHVERDLLSSLWQNQPTHFNSHAHVERDLWEWAVVLLLPKFQLTRSRGAWHMYQL